MLEAVLMSIHPRFAEAILDGRKKFEFRRTRIKKPVSQLVIYSTSPKSAVVGIAQVKSIREGSPEELWRQCSSYGAIAEEEFFDYFSECDTAIALELGEVERYPEAIPLNEMFPGVRPPQSFCYV